ncbi:hypothetical protein [Streptomyces heilongjiangensis]|uniref:CopG family transcriptional regulator n=2 Tax=Streptomyces heilongjiangensis TaxID=945052 RepID=A0ABW1B0X2_9ACTN|nr:hypothetical protein [Streptomyces heilongjiangensis]MDC2945670.1 hypothetical protein [Streptomyces heilongjiangensis]
MPAGRVAAVKARVGARGFSAYVSAAVERQLQRDLLEELLQAKEDEIGRPSPEVLDRAAEIFQEAEALAADERRAEATEGDEGAAWPDRKAG